MWLNFWIIVYNVFSLVISWHVVLKCLIINVVGRTTNHSLELYWRNVNTPKFVHAGCHNYSRTKQTRDRHWIVWFTIDCTALPIVCIYSDMEERTRICRSYLQRSSETVGLFHVFRIDIYISSLLPNSSSSSCSSTASPSRAHTYFKLSAQLSNWSW